MANYFHWPTFKKKQSYFKKKILRIYHYLGIIHYDKDVLLKVSFWINVTTKTWETVWQDDNALKLISNIFMHIEIQWVHENSNINKGSDINTENISVSAADKVLRETRGSRR